MPVVTRTTQAEDDLVDILHRIARYSVRAAARLRDELDRGIRVLAQSPLLGRERTDLQPELSSHTVAGQYLVFYRRIDAGIELVRVLHGSRDIGPDLFEG